MRLKRTYEGAASDPESFLNLREVAVRLAGSAAKELRARNTQLRIGFDGISRCGLDIQAKSSALDLVTKDDRDVESLIRNSLAQERPNESVIGEEAGGNLHELDGVRWVVDPIDGTTNYVYGIHGFAVSIAAQMKGTTVAGAVADVMGGLVFSAALGCGAQVQTTSGDVMPLQCNSLKSAAAALIGTGFSTRVTRRGQQGKLVGELLPRIRDIRHIGSAALDLCMVATGQLDAQYEHGLSLWDWAAGALIAYEAGAYLSLPPVGTASSAGEIVAACAPGIADELDQIFGELRIWKALP